MRWQGQTMAQLSTALSVLSGLSLAGLSFLFSLLRETTFKPTGWVAAAYLLAVAAFFVASVAGVAALITRLLDFRLTARKVREGDSEKPLSMFGATASGYGKATWCLFWVVVVCLLVGVVLAASSVSVVYLGGGFRAACF